MAAKVIVITGANGGFGRALSQRFADDGDTVIMLGRSLAKVAEVAAAIGPNAWPLECQISDPDSVRAAFATIAARHPRIDVVINTHHHRDHTAGNGVFRPVAGKIVAQANVPELQLAAAARSGTESEQVLADETFAEFWRRDLGDEVVTAQYLGAAHTNGDAIVHFERANVVHMGDLVFNRLYPVIDRPAGASIRHWISVLEEAVAYYPKDAIYIFGHGKPDFGVTGVQGDLLVFRDYLAGLLAHVQREIAAGKSRAEIVGLVNLPGFDDYHAPAPNRLAGNLGTAYDELTAERG